MTLLTATRSLVTSFTRMNRAANYIRSVSKRYELQEVIYTAPFGQQQTGVITRFIWEDSVGLEGDWMIFVAFDDSSLQYGTWTSFESLFFTGNKR